MSNEAQQIWDFGYDVAGVLETTLHIPFEVARRLVVNHYDVLSDCFKAKTTPNACAVRLVNKFATILEREGAVISAYR
jgi:hypothetical protein